MLHNFKGGKALYEVVQNIFFNGSTPHWSNQLIITAFCQNIKFPYECFLVVFIWKRQVLLSGKC